MKRMRVVTIAIVMVSLGIGIIYWDVLFPHSEEKELTSNQGERPLFSYMAGGSGDPKTAFDTSHYARCRQLLNQQNTHNFNWARDNYLSWNDFIDEEEYSLDDVTLAVEYFLNPNFADEFRVEYLRNTAPTSKKNKELNKRFWDMEPSLKDWGVSVRIAIPNPALEDFTSLTLAEKKQILAGHSVSVDDVAYMLLDENASDDVIFMLLEALNDPYAYVSYDRYATTSLLDYAIMAHRVNVVETLLKQGYKPTQDNYLGSSMEWALSALTYGYYAGKRDPAANIVLLLMDYGVPARFQTQTAESIEGYFPRHFYKFDNSEIQSLIVDYNLDLTSIIQREAISVEKAHSLIKTLEKQRLASTQERLNIPALPSISAECEAQVSELNSRWKPRDIQQVVDEVASPFKGDESAIIQALADIEPSLVDYYKRQKIPNNKGVPTGQALIDNINAAYTFFEDGKAQQGIDLILSGPVHESQYEFIMYRLLNFQSDYSTVVQSPFWVGLSDYNKLSTWRLLKSDFIESMQALGVSVYKPDTYNKGLVYYAALKRDSALITYLFENNFQYSGDSLGQDPLHIALNIGKNYASLSHVESTVDALMQFNPEVDRFHKSRMRLMQLYYPDSYERIATRYPSLRLDEGEPVKLPPTYLYNP